MAITTYSGEPHGFGLTYDDARLDCVDDSGDPRLAAAWWSRITNPVAAAVLFTTPGAAAAEIAAGSALSVLFTTDDLAADPRGLGDWDWDAATERESLRYLEQTGAPGLCVDHFYWRGFPIVQLVARPLPEAGARYRREQLGMLYTPQRTFMTHMVMPEEGLDECQPRAQELMDGFFLLPLEREGVQRTGHKHVRRLGVAPTAERDGVTYDWPLPPPIYYLSE
jgi:hypothetical protein